MLVGTGAGGTRIGLYVDWRGQDSGWSGGQEGS